MYGLLDIPPNVDFYHLLGITYDAPLSTIKAAYHKALLTSHPDKRSPSSSTPHVHVDIALLKEAYTTLSNVSSRIAYDDIIRNTRAKAPAGPRPAQVISLEDFEEVEEGVWKHTCRCGGTYNIAEEDMDAGRHLVGCESCSEVVWVGYKLADNEGGKGN
ncbi:hypothetical protein K503DRAFT_791916 [Rhizopogon vinicolor AM-OR11-026]|uniref:Diphthamide biosynthesis protein 4 n=1 Tax=Rhizopogon vinicolor AM-OR11-026 TaxID=1314800 RepID=A0A1B7N3X0_9AGAM|nr:hypothetical protein K503DRAFT_791916 [Rhizopogon vinicolor AM-OR11-026]